MQSLGIPLAQSLYPPIPQSTAPPSDQRVVHYGRSWEQFKSIQTGFDQAPGVRLFYYDGTVEVLMPGREHELFSWVIGHLVGLFLAQRGVFFQPTGSMTQEKEREVSAQADQSFCVGSVKPIPDLSIEVIFTSGGVDKLARYRALGVPEVWLWQDGVLMVYGLRVSEGEATPTQGYEQCDRSQLAGLQDLDLDLLRRCILLAETDTGAAIRQFQQGIALST
ncbi:Uma2 family endonuclease [Nodosilinea sp. PGN35]